MVSVSCSLPYIEKSLNKSTFKMDVYIANLYISNSCFIGSCPLALLKIVQKEAISPHQELIWQLSLGV